MNDKRLIAKHLIDVAFPLRETSIDAVHEKNVRHGHISTLRIWPARRPLAACRAALIATLLPDPSAGGGAIPLKANRLGCEVTAMDINRFLSSSQGHPSQNLECSGQRVPRHS